MESSHKISRFILIAVVVLVALFQSTSAQVPPTPTGVTLQFLGTAVIEFKWTAVVGDFDTYLAVYYDGAGNELANDVIAKTETSFRYLVNDPNVAAYSFHTVKGTTRSGSADVTPLPGIVFNIQLPNALLGPKDHTSISIGWVDAPDPADNITQYVISLEQPAGTLIDQANVDAVAGATHTFQGLNVGEEYRIRVDAILQDGIPVEVNIFEDTWTIPYPPSNGILHRTSSTTGTLTWTEARAPFDYYELVITPQGGEARVLQYPLGTSGIMLGDLQNGVTYGYTLKTVVNTGNRLIKSDTSDLTLVQQAATSLDPALEAITDHSMHLTWTASQTAGLDGYVVSILDRQGNAIMVDIPSTDSSFTLTGLEQGTQYELVLDEVVGGVSQFVGSIVGATKVPQNVQFGGATAHTMTITWDSALFGNAEGYLVNVISTDGSYNSLIPVDAALASAPYTIANLPAGLEYEVGVDAVVGGLRFEVGALTEPASTTTSIATQVVTTDLILTAWEAIPGATYSLLLTNLGDGTTQEVTIADSTTTTHAFTGLTPGQHYTIDLTAHLNNEVIFGGQVAETTIPLPPTNINLVPTATDTTITWSPPPNTPTNVYEGYRVVYTQQDGEPAFQDLPRDQTTFTVPVVDNGQNIFVHSSSGTQLSQSLHPDANYNVNLGGATSSSLQVTYDQYGGQGYRVLLVGADGTVHGETVVDNPATLSHVFTGLQPSTDYTAVVTGIDVGGETTFLLGSDTAQTAAAVEFDYQLATTPVTTTTMDIAWQHNPDAGFESYQLVVTSAADNSVQTFTVPAGANPAQVVQGLTPGVDYAVDVSGVVGGVPQIVVSARQSTVPEPPAVTVMNENADTSVELTWFPPTSGNADNYIIRYGPYGSTTLQEVVLGPNILNYQLPVFNPAQQHTVQIFSSVGANQELVSVQGNIQAPTNGFSVVINPSCLTNPCLNGGVCSIDPTIGYVCACTVLYTGLNCDILVDGNDCDPNLCLNGLCVDGVNAFTCNCAGTDFTGTFCESQVDNCLLNPCTNGVCVDGVLSFTCNCAGTDFTGTLCEIQGNDCEPNLCLNGLCIDGVNAFTCNCAGTDFTGILCESQVDNCLLNPCTNGVCVDGILSFTCNCAGTDFTGTLCEIPVDACPVPDPCKNGGVCVDGTTPGAYTCDCLTGFTGTLCDGNADDCVNTPCLNNGRCIDGNNAYTCDCSLVDYQGTNCETFVNDCVSNPCLNGLCVDGLRSYTCDCSGTDFTGMLCQTHVNDCNPDPCANGVCVDGVRTYTCNCVGTDFTGTRCETQVDNCADSPCINGVCADGVLTFTCNCAGTDFTGTRCENRINDCVVNPCINGVCVDGVLSYTCNCAGTDYEGIICQNRIDNCLPNPCTNGVCVDGVLSFTCNCVGTDFTGTLCEIPVDNCRDSPCINGVCQDGLLTYTCNCGGTDFTGTRCETRVDDCAASPCIHGICVDGVLSYTCNCEGTDYEGLLCQNQIDDCVGNLCTNGVCVDGFLTYTCDCSGTDFQGTLCADRINDCPIPDPCQNGGVCVDGTTPRMYSCNCPEGFTGFFCNNAPSQCANNPCVNGACLEGLNSYTCICDGTDFSGTNCETKINDCLPNPCLNGGACTDGTRSYTCDCVNGYQGTRCETDTNECISNPCENSANCVNQINAYRCDCQPGFEGPTCSININECLLNPTVTKCVNGGTCQDAVNGYTCNCPNFFSGDRCQINDNECASNPCVFGFCEDGISRFDCQCFPGYQGIFCETNTDECISSPCQNNGRCDDMNNFYLCTCTNQFQGTHCETPITANVLITVVEPDRIQGTFVDIMTDPQARYQVTISNSQGQVVATRPYSDADVVNGMVNFDFGNLQPGTDYKVDLQVVAADGTSYDLDSVSTRTTTICNTNICLNGGICREQTATPGYLCDCPPGVDGLNCENDINECLSNPCLNNGLCINLQAQFRCQCVGAWTGPFCNVPMLVNFYPGPSTTESVQVVWDEPTGTSVPNYVVTLENVGGGVLTTATVPSTDIVNGLFGFTFHAPQPGTSYISRLYALLDDGTRLPLGTINTSSESICSTGPCENGGTCLVAAGTPLGYRCFCVAGYEGDNCQLDINECLSAPCRNNAQCINAVNAYSCVCNIGWMGAVCNIPSSNQFVLGEITTNTVEVFWPSVSIQGTTNFAYRLEVTDPNGATTQLAVPAVPNADPNYVYTQVIPGLQPSTQYRVSLVVVSDGTEYVVGTQAPTTKSVCTSLRPCQNQGICIPDPTAAAGYTCLCLDGWTGLNCDQDFAECNSGPCQNGGRCVERFLGYACECRPEYQGLHCQVSMTNMLTVTGVSAQDAQLAFPPLADPSVLLYYLTLRQDATGQEHSLVLSPDQAQNGLIEQSFVNLTPSTKYTAHLSVMINGEPALLNLGQRDVTTLNICAFITCQNGGNCVPDNSQALFYRCDCLPGFSGQFCAGDIDNCAALPCLNGGGCIDGQGTFTCTCASGYTGQTCQIQVNECASSPCLNLGQCSDRVNAFECSCAAGYTGGRCETDINECLSGPCVNGALCQDDVNRYACTCSPGYRGVNCQENIDECASNPCLNGGACTDQVNRYVCTCRSGFFGTRCESDFDDCGSNPCLNGGLCTDLPSSFQCTCPTGYSGLRCETAPNACDASPCLNGGACISQAGGYACICQARWQGTNCQEAISPCENRPCLNGGNCVALVGALYRCDCLAGYQGDICSIDIQECASNPCLNNGVCMDRVNGYACICFNDYAGVNCHINTSPCSSNPCVNGFCLSNVGQYFCFCSTAWTATNCDQPLDVQECASGPCFNGGTCLEQFSSYTCLCPAGYTGLNCEADVNECTRTPFLCLNGGNCINFVGSYQCICVEGFEGVTCQTQSARCTVGYCVNGGTCREGLPGPSCDCLLGFQGTRCEQQTDFCQGVVCQNGGICSQGATTYICQCPMGFGGFHCETNVDDCSPSPCLNGGRCQDGVNVAICVCPPGYTGNTCALNVDDCLVPGLCLNGATCVDGLNAYSCLCVPGYTGDRCQMDIPECNSNPCQNGGICLEQVDMYVCQCQGGYTGTHCQIIVDVNECASNPCWNGALCVDGANAFTCQCTAGFAGALCQTDVDECASGPCFNQGRCVDGVNQFLCVCQAGFTGALCTVSPCVNHRCLNGAQCAVTATSNLGYVCVCSPAYTGPFCESLIDGDDCSPVNPCTNSGTCIDGLNTYTCSCLLGFTGTLCEININECVSQPCVNGGACTDQINGYFCTCPAEYTGEQCQIRIFTPCQPNPCANSGVCTPLSSRLNAFLCTCPPGYTGLTCQNPPQTRCEPSPCLNGGTCIAIGTTSYTCACRSEYTGQNCETVIVIDPCNSNPCLNGGQCTRSNSGAVVFYFCTCFNGYTGLNCQMRSNPCNSNPCRNGGACALLPSNAFGYFCTCVNNFLGTNCETANPCASNPCVNGGTCSRLNQGTGVIYVCTCLVGYTGNQCQVAPPDPCNSRPCLNGGQCSVSAVDVSAFMCTCGPFNYGDRCQFTNDPCSSGPCLNGAICASQLVGSSFTFLCQCVSGYTGTRCSVPPTDPCLQQPCRNGGTCIRVTNFAYTCQCTPEYTGSTCTTLATTPCTQNPCLNGGSCFINGANFVCNCLPGYSGSTCQILGVCTLNNPCLNGGNCLQSISSSNEYRCACQFGYTGNNCEIVVPTACASSPCLNQGACIVTSQTVYTCNCISGYTGSICQTLVACSPNPCLNGGQCSASLSNSLVPICSCTQEFTGDRCQNALTTPCSDRPCLNGATCTVTGTFTYACTCAAGYTGTACESIIVCSLSPCLNGATCMISFSNPAEYFCNCPAAFNGNNCQFATQTACSSSPCLNGGACTNSDNGVFACGCRQGYSGIVCQIIVACQSNPCQNGGLCTVNSGTPTQMVCTCPSTHTGVFCETAVPVGDLCDPNPCLYGGTCTVDSSQAIGYRCRCVLGYTGVNCDIVVTLCSSPCTNGGTCFFDQTHAVYTCSCLPGFSGYQCQISGACGEDITLTEGQEVRITSPGYPNDYPDNLRCLFHFAASSAQDRRLRIVMEDLATECDRDLVQVGLGSDPADPTSVVMRESGKNHVVAPFFLDADAGWLTFASDYWKTGKGFSVLVQDVAAADSGLIPVDCQPGFCSNGGMCVLRPGPPSELICVCAAGYEGDNCQTNVDECVSNPCLFGGECSDVINGYICLCLAGRGGPHCELSTTNPCQDEPCLNSGVCFELSDGAYVCICTTGYTGRNCQSTVVPGNPCSSSPCLNGGFCYNLADQTFQCNCAANYQGTFCEIAITLCGSSPCFNGATCVDTTGNIVCNCREGYAGTFCEMATTDCICQNGGICFGANFCICPSAFTGQFCETDINECVSNPCLNNGICVDYQGYYICACLTGFSGLTCATRDPNTAGLSGSITASADGNSGNTLSVGWIIMIVVLGVLLLLLLVFVVARSWKKYDDRYSEDKSHILSDYEDNRRYQEPSGVEMGDILLPAAGSSTVARLNTREEAWPVSTDEMPTSNI